VNLSRLRNSPTEDGAPCITLLLGENGAGKSFLLNQLVLSLRFLHRKDDKTQNKLKYDCYEMEFSDSSFSESHVVSLVKEGKKYLVQNEMDEEMIPKRVLAVTESFPDKFEFEKEFIDEYYIYLGHKNQTNAIFEKNANGTTLKRLFQIFRNDLKASAFQNILNSIGYEGEPIILYGMEELRLRQAADNKKLDSDKFRLAFRRNGGIEDNAIVAWEWLSAGERHVIKSFCDILSFIVPGSLILIDEPEVSLHPSWQIKYVPLLQKTFKGFKNCQFIIASHSHFIATGLPKGKSFLLSISRIDNYKHATRELYDDYSGTSAERILYEVFGVTTTHNLFFQQDLEQVVSYLESHKKESRKPDEKTKEAFSRLKRFVKGWNDPLRLIIEEGEKRIGV
jgi:predicted ATPase